MCKYNINSLRKGIHFCDGVFHNYRQLEHEVNFDLTLMSVPFVTVLNLINSIVPDINSSSVNFKITIE